MSRSHEFVDRHEFATTVNELPFIDFNAELSQFWVRVHVQCRYYGEVMTDDTLTDPLHTLDLRNRGITSIADGGLGCYTMQSVIPPPNAERWHQSDLLTHLK